MKFPILKPFPKEWLPSPKEWVGLGILFALIILARGLMECFFKN